MRLSLPSYFSDGRIEKLGGAILTVLEDAGGPSLNLYSHRGTSSTERVMFHEMLPAGLAAEQR